LKTEKGIYCELNLAQSITYCIPPGSDPQSLSVLRDALVQEAIGDDAICGASASASASANVATSATAIAGSSGQPKTDLAIVQKKKKVRRCMSGLSEAEPVTFLDVKATRSRRSVSVKLEDAVGRISAETVSDNYLLLL
jgi:hypothetical protein